MANAQVEKLKDLGLRHGEKAVVGLAGLLCLLFLVSAAKKSIEITPEQVSKHADAAHSNLPKPQEPQDILTIVEAAGIKNPGFVALVEAQEKEGLKPDDFPVARSWVTPEPGAGLIRDKPELIAATDLYAYPGRGGACVYALEDGKRVPEDPNAKKATRRSGSQEANGGSARGKDRRPESQLRDDGRHGVVAGRADEEAEEEARRPEKRRQGRKILDSPARRRRQVGGRRRGRPVQGSDQGAPLGGHHRRHRPQEAAGQLPAALKDSTVAHPNYKQLDVERQVHQADGSWSEWQAVDIDKNHEITYNLPEEEEELTPDTVRLQPLVDPLPFLKAGYWERVHVASLCPRKSAKIDKDAAAGMIGGAGMMGDDMVAQQPMPWENADGPMIRHGETGWAGRPATIPPTSRRPTPPTS